MAAHREKSGKIGNRNLSPEESMYAYIIVTCVAYLRASGFNQLEGSFSSKPSDFLMFACYTATSTVYREYKASKQSFPPKRKVLD